MTRLPNTIPVLAVATNLIRARRRDRSQPEHIEALRSRLLQQLVQHAYTRVPYYRRVLDPTAVAEFTGTPDLARLPILDRKVLNEVGCEQLLADGFTVDNTRSAATSGSSGVPVVAYYSEHDLGYLRATYLWDLLACGLRPWDRVGFFRLGGFRRHRLERFGLVRNIHINTGEDLDHQVAAFLAGRPTFLWGFPNAIASLAAELQRRGVSYRGVRNVIFAGESLADSARAEVLDYFGARGHDVYSTVEAYTIARSCPRGVMHLRSADVVVEVERDDGTVALAESVTTSGEELEGEILVTRLHAEAMPLLRYRVGDRVRIGPNDCPCQVMHTPILRQLVGRVEDRLYTRDGRARNGTHLSGLIDGLEGIRQYQFVQRRQGQVELLLVSSHGADPDEVVARVSEALSAAAGEFDLSVTSVDAITPGPNGKIRRVRSELPSGTP
jgi:phenylacetate-CoA ligase